ncbi:hypothetical protein IPC1219_08465 [Pseudomonas aeruginosa]|nr:hypothetical protein IPC1219_08465 [Pseudomonas aeruginosa]
MSGQGNRVVYGLTGWSGRVSRVVPVAQPRRANNRLAVIRRLPMAAANNAYGVIRPPPRYAQTNDPALPA